MHHMKSFHISFLIGPLLDIFGLFSSVLLIHPYNLENILSWDLGWTIPKGLGKFLLKFS
jgi:hypothetical protein